MYGDLKVSTWIKFFAAISQPPGLNCILLLLGIYYWLRSNKFMSVFFLIGGTVFLYLISTPAISNKLLDNLETQYQSLNFSSLINQKDPKAIVSLAAVDPSDSWMINKNTAWLAKATGLPVLVSGNNYILEYDSTNNVVEKMAKSLSSDFGVNGTIWVESKGYYLKQNAQLVQKILKQNGIKKIFLLTNAWRMNRAEKVFKSFDLEIVPAPLVKKALTTNSQLQNFTPRIDCLLNSSYYFFCLFEGFWSKLFDMFA